MNPPLLRVNNLEVVYHHTIQVLKGLSLSVPEGAIVALLGSNGAGKTTTLKAISGLLPLEDGEIVDGEITFRGGSIAGKLPHRIVREGLFQVMEGRRIFEHLTVEENLECASYARSGAVDLGADLRKVFTYFPRLRERRKQLGGYLSGGEQQMLAMARILRTGATILLLDEITEGLAPVIVQALGRVVRQLKDRGYTIVLVEQNFRFAAPLADRHHLLEHGRVVDTIEAGQLAGRMESLQEFLGV